MEAASNVAVVLLGVIAIFQLGLALGAPWGKAAWGGQNPGVLPTGLRVASGLAAVVVYPLIALVRAGLCPEDRSRLVAGDRQPGHVGAGWTIRAGHDCEPSLSIEAGTPLGSGVFGACELLAR